MAKKQEQKDELEKQTEENVKLSRELNETLTKALEKVLLDPSLESIKAYYDLEKALLAEWSKAIFKSISSDISKAVSQGKILAQQQLEAKGFKLVNAPPEEISRVLTTAREEAKSQIEKVVSAVKTNSRRIISEATEAELLSKKKISKATLEKLKKFGVAFFVDAGGSTWSLTRWIDMFTTTAILSAQRKAFFTESLSQGNDLVKIIHLNVSPECELCKPYTNRVLSISGRTKGYMSIEEAKASGLFHPNCDHVAQEFELSPNKEDDDNLIALSEENLKAMQKKGYKLSDIQKKPYYEP